MFAARGGFLYQTATNVSSFGNSAFWAPEVSLEWPTLSTTSSTSLINWKSTTGFTVEFWIYASNWPIIINPGPGNHDGFGENYWSFGPGVNGVLEFYFWSPGQTFLRTNINALTLDVWHNVAIVFTTISGGSTTATMYIDGVRQQIQLGDGPFANNQTIPSGQGVVSVTAPFTVGAYGGLSVYNNVYFDNLRVSNVNRYSGSNYTLATAPFTSDTNTQLLLICDGPNGSTTFTDSSGFARTITNGAGGGDPTAVNNIVISDARANHS